MLEIKIAAIIVFIGVVWFVVRSIKASGKLEAELKNAMDSLQVTGNISEMERKEMEKIYERKARYRGNMSKFLSDLRDRVRR